MSNDAENTAGLLPVVYQDDWFVAVSKPAGMFVHRTEMDRRILHVVMQTVRNQMGRPVFLIHRLDRPASGLILFGLSSEAAARMSTLFRDRQVTKSYAAIVRGHCSGSGRIERPLRKPNVQSSALRPAVTTWQTVCRYNIPLRSDRFHTTHASLLNVIPLTGRFHQIRRHFNGASHPLIGDTSHGDSRQNRFFRDQFGVDRLMLHAQSLGFQHPFTEETTEIHCPAPEDFATVLERLEPHLVE